MTLSSPAGGNRAAAVLWLCLVCGFSSSSESHAGLRVQPDLAVRTFLSVGDLAALSPFGYGGDFALQVANTDGGFGVRSAVGYLRLQGHSIPTGEVIFNGTGTQEGKFEATQSFWWIAVGPSWDKPVGAGLVSAYCMLGRADVRAGSSLGWIDTAGSDPGSTRVALLVAGLAWKPGEGPFVLGTDLYWGGSAAFWDDPPVRVDAGGTHVLQSATASLTGITLSMAYRFGNRSAKP